MKWKIEQIVDKANILIDDPKLTDMDKVAVGIGLPIALAERIVNMHNEALQKITSDFVEGLRAQNSSER